MGKDEKFCERTTCQKYSVKLKEALSKQIEMLEKWQKLALVSKKPKTATPPLQDQQLAQSNLNFRPICDTELRFNKQKLALVESTKTEQRTKENVTVPSKLDMRAESYARFHSSVSVKRLS